MKDKLFTRVGIQYLLHKVFWFENTSPWMKVFREKFYENQLEFARFLNIALWWKEEIKKNNLK